MNEHREFLLGGLTPAEREQIHQRMFAEDTFFEELCEAEYELIDDCARGLPGAPAAERFETRRLAVARALARASGKRTRPFLWMLPLAAAVVLAIAVGGIMRFGRQAPAPAPAGTALVVALTPSGERSPRAPASVTIPADAQSVEFRLAVDPRDSYPTFEARLLRGAAQAGTFAGLTARDGVVTFRAPTPMTPGNYEIGLMGRRADGSLEAIGYYYMDVLAP